MDLGQTIEPSRAVAPWLRAGDPQKLWEVRMLVVEPWAIAVPESAFRRVGAEVVISDRNRNSEPWNVVRIEAREGTAGPGHVSEQALSKVAV